MDKKSYSLEQLRDFDAKQLSELVRDPKMGKHIYKAIRKVGVRGGDWQLRVIDFPNLRFPGWS